VKAANKANAIQASPETEKVQDIDESSMQMNGAMRSANPEQVLLDGGNA